MKDRGDGGCRNPEISDLGKIGSDGDDRSCDARGQEHAEGDGGQRGRQADEAGDEGRAIGALGDVGEIDDHGQQQAGVAGNVDGREDDFVEATVRRHLQRRRNGSLRATGGCRIDRGPRIGDVLADRRGEPASLARDEKDRPVNTDFEARQEVGDGVESQIDLKQRGGSRLSGLRHQRPRRDAEPTLSELVGRQPE
jgi:hypothetical protein